MATRQESKLHLDFNAMRKRAVGKETDEEIVDAYFDSLIKMAVLFFVDERNWHTEELPGGQWGWVASMEITYLLHADCIQDPCQVIRTGLSKALGPVVNVEEIQVDYRGDYAFGDIVCVQL